MNRAEAAKLCYLVANYCGGQHFNDVTPDAWVLVLKDVDYDDAKDAVVELASMELKPGESRYIEPGHIIAGVRRIRTRRIDNYGPIDPPSGIGVADYLDWYRTTRDAIASGRAPERPADIENPEGRRRALALVANLTEALPSIESA